MEGEILDDTQFHNFDDSITDRLKNDKKGVKFKVLNLESPYKKRRQDEDDHNACGVIVADEIPKKNIWQVSQHIENS